MAYLELKINARSKWKYSVQGDLEVLVLEKDACLPGDVFSS